MVAVTFDAGDGHYVAMGSTNDDASTRTAHAPDPLSYEATVRAGGWPWSTTPPAFVNPQAMVLLPSSSSGVAVDASDTVVNVWTDTVPSAATIAAWEAAAGRMAAVTVTSQQVFAALKSRLASPSPENGLAKFLAHTTDAFAVSESGWPRVSSVLVRPGFTLMPVSSLSGDVLASSPVFSAADVADLRRDVGLTSTSGPVSLSGPDVRLRFSNVGANAVAVKALRASPASAQQAWLPDVATRLTRPGGGVVVVASEHGGGRSSLAFALAAHACGARAGMVVVASDCPDWSESSTVFTVTCTSSALSMVLSDAAAAGASTAVVDFVYGTDLSAVWQAAGAGLLVVVTVAAASVSAALSAVVDGDCSVMAADLLRGVVVRRLLPGADGSGLTPVDASVLNTAAVAAALRGQRFDALEVAVEMSGRAAGVLADTALARAVSAGRVRADVAAPFVADPDRYAAASGRLAQVSASVEVDVDGEDDWGWMDAAPVPR